MASLTAGAILFEYVIPRMGKRADVILVLPNAIVVLEFKVGASGFSRADIDQVYDYALDLKNFHLGSHSLPIIPILCATAAPSDGKTDLSWSDDYVAQPLLIGPQSLAETMTRLANLETGAHVAFESWIESGYKPTPTIVEAAQALFQQHGVEDITRSDAGARNLTATTSALQKIIEASKLNRQKSICFVTGVPGAGKTLAGLNVATTRAKHHTDEHAVFLSGNGPLVDVLREALSRDESARHSVVKSEAYRRVSNFIQNIHHFRDEAIRDKGAPVEKVVVFDEAQRAWTREQASKFMKTKRQLPDFSMSEPEFLISVMDRHQDWCLIVCLIGGGQEINTGEAGLSEWLSAVRNKFPGWKVYISDRIAGEDYLNAEAKDALAALNSTVERDLHLAVSMRSFRAETLSDFVGHIVNNKTDLANSTHQQLANRYPIRLTRSLHEAKEWVRGRARGSERFGLLASSGAHRLRPEGIHIKAKIDPPVWFLNDRNDVRSSFYCEEVATEFDVQGLELDWAIVCWDADFRHDGQQWQSYEFKGTRWQSVRSPTSQDFLRNAYRVIMTRARQGMVVFVPEGDDRDPTRPRSFYDGTWEFLKRCGLARG